MIKHHMIQKPLPRQIVSGQQKTPSNTGSKNPCQRRSFLVNDKPQATYDPNIPAKVGRFQSTKASSNPRFKNPCQCRSFLVNVNLWQHMIQISLPNQVISGHRTSRDLSIGDIKWNHDQSQRDKNNSDLLRKLLRKPFSFNVIIRPRNKSTRYMAVISPHCRQNKGNISETGSHIHSTPSALHKLAPLPCDPQDLYKESRSHCHHGLANSRQRKK